MASPLPVLDEPTAKRYQTCPGRELCPGCPLYEVNGGPCSGCTDEYRGRCLQGRCFSRCNICGGGLHSVVPAACGRSPLRDVWAKLILEPLAPYSPEPLSIETPLIPIIYGQSALREIPGRFPEIDAWSIPVHKALNRRGEFRSRDMKDYLCLDASRKLILSTAGPDDFMEMLWERGGDLDYRGHGFDCWFPAHFSVYDNDSKFYQFFNARRQQMHARMVHSQFVWFRLGEHVPVSWLEPIFQCPSVLISCQQMRSRFHRDILRREIAIADRLFPPSACFFLLGAGYGARMRKDRCVYEIHASWVIRSLSGYFLWGKPCRDLSRQELLEFNLRSLYESVLSRRRAESCCGAQRLAGVPGDEAGGASRV